MSINSFRCPSLSWFCFGLCSMFWFVIINYIPCHTFLFSFMSIHCHWSFKALAIHNSFPSVLVRLQFHHLPWRFIILFVCIVCHSDYHVVFLVCLHLWHSICSIVTQSVVHSLFFFFFFACICYHLCTTCGSPVNSVAAGGVLKQNARVTLSFESQVIARSGRNDLTFRPTCHMQIAWSANTFLLSMHVETRRVQSILVVFAIKRMQDNIKQQWNKCASKLKHDRRINSNLERAMLLARRTKLCITSQMKFTIALCIQRNRFQMLRFYSLSVCPLSLSFVLVLVCCHSFAYLFGFIHCDASSNVCDA